MHWFTNSFKRVNRVLNVWLAARRRPDDFDGLALLPLFLSMRAAIRAKVAGPRAARLKQNERAEAEAEARSMFSAARAFLDPPPPRLVAIGGLSGTGKTTVARGVAAGIGPAPGAVLVRSDVIRKVLSGVPETERLPADSYTPDRSAAVYETANAWAARAVAAGHAAIVDAVHAKPSERDAVRVVAGAAGVPFDGIWLDAPPDRLIERVDARTGDASDADATVVRRQLRYDVGAIDWTIVDTADGPETAITKTQHALGIGRDTRSRR